MICCQLAKGTLTRRALIENFEVVKEYDPQPKNKDGSVRWFLYRWDDGKNGVRRLARCKHCGSFFLFRHIIYTSFRNMQMFNLRRGIL